MRASLKFTLWFLLVANLVAAAPRRPWYFAESEHFEMMSATSVKESQELLADFEEFHALLQIAFGNPSLAKKRTTIVVFEYKEDFENYKPFSADGSRRNVAAYFLGHPEESMIAMVAGPANALEVREVVYHEYVHHFFNLMGYRLPLWLNEGLAELFSTMRIKKGRIEIGLPKREYLTSRMVSFGRVSWLFSMDAKSEGYQQGFQQANFYANSWGLVHFWFCGPDNFEHYLKFLNLLENTNLSSSECMEQAFGMDDEQMGEALRKYMDAGRYQLRYLPLNEKPRRVSPAFRRATEFEREFILLNLEARAVGTSDRVTRLLGLAERYPESPRPYETLAAIAGLNDNVPQRTNYYQKAIERGSLNSYVHALHAELILAKVDIASALDYRMPEAEADPLRQGLRTALEANPNHLASLEQLAFLESVAAKPSLASVELVQKEVKRMRDPRDTLLSLAVIRWRINDDATSELLLKMLDRKKPLEGTAAHRRMILEERLHSDLGDY